MGVFVCVEMRRLNIPGDDLLHLCPEFRIWIDSAGREKFQQLRPALWQRFSGHQGSPLNQDKMASHIECWNFMREPHGILKRVTVCHQGCRGENAVLMSVHDSSVHVVGEAEIICIHNQCCR